MTIEILRRAGRQISSSPDLPFNSEREAVLWLELNNIKELSRRCWVVEKAPLIN
jgi:hypothetical protein